MKVTGARKYMTRAVMRGTGWIMLTEVRKQYPRMYIRNPKLMMQEI
jgi:hypothetical protein